MAKISDIISGQPLINDQFRNTNLYETYFHEHKVWYVNVDWSIFFPLNCEKLFYRQFWSIQLVRAKYYHRVQKNPDQHNMLPPNKEFKSLLLCEERYLPDLDTK